MIEVTLPLALVLLMIILGGGFGYFVGLTHGRAGATVASEDDVVSAGKRIEDRLDLIEEELSALVMVPEVAPRVSKDDPLGTMNREQWVTHLHDLYAGLKASRGPAH